MAVTSEKSTQETRRATTPLVKTPGREYNGRKVTFHFDFTQGAAAGDANSLADLIMLPAGKIRVLPQESKIQCSAFGAARTLDIGLLAHVNLDKTAVAATIDTLLDGGDVSAAAILTMGAGTNALVTHLDLDSREGVVVQAKVLGDTIPAGATLSGYITAVID